MNRIFAAAAFLLALVIPAAAGDFVHEIVEPTVQLQRNCSGTFVLSERNEETGDVQTLILTAKHCVAKEKIGQEVPIHYPIYNAESRRFKEEILYGKVKGKHFKYDLAIIELVDVDTLYKTIATVADKNFQPERFSDVWASGYPMGLTQTVTEGTFNQRTTIEQAPYKEEIFVTTVPIAGGSSGGGLYAQQGDKYVLIGVASMGTKDFPYALWVPIDAIADYLGTMIKPKKAPSTGLGAQ